MNIKMLPDRVSADQRIAITGRIRHGAQGRRTTTVRCLDGWSIDRLGRSVLDVANALAELDAAGAALYSDQQAIASTTPMGRAMIQMASVFGEQERQIIRSRVLAGLDRVRQQGKKLGRPKVSPKIEDAIRRHLSAGHGILKVAALVGVGSGTRETGDGRGVCPVA